MLQSRNAKVDVVKVEVVFFLHRIEINFVRKDFVGEDKKDRRKILTAKVLKKEIVRENSGYV